MDIFRVYVKETHSLQPDGYTSWTHELLYIGTSRVEARLAYHRSTLDDFNRNFGGAVRLTVCESIEDSGTYHFDRDIITERSS